MPDPVAPIAPATAGPEPSAPDAFADLWAEPVMPVAAASAEPRVIRGWERPADIWGKPAHVGETEGNHAPPARGGRPTSEMAAALDRAQRLFADLGPSTVTAFARFGARAAR